MRARARAAHATRSALPRLYTGHDAPPPANRAASTPAAWIRRGPGVGEGGEPAPRARGCRHVVSRMVVFGGGILGCRPEAPTVMIYQQLVFSHCFLCFQLEMFLNKLDECLKTSGFPVTVLSIKHCFLEAVAVIILTNTARWNQNFARERTANVTSGSADEAISKYVNNINISLYFKL